MAIRLLLLVVFNTVVNECLLEDRRKIMGRNLCGSRVADNSQNFLKPVVRHKQERQTKCLPGVSDHIDCAVGLASFHLTDAGWLTAGPTGNIVQTPMSAVPGSGQLPA
jgi:hypothetical protein